MTFIRKLNRRLALPFAAIAVIIIAAAAVIAPNLPPPPALAQSNSAAPANVAARNGANIGEVVVSWTPNAAAVSNRVGWANYAEVQTARDAGNWLEAFNFVEIGGAKTSYTVKRLEPDAQHAFIVATIAANGAYTYSAWVFHTTAAPTPTPAPTSTPCPTPGAGGQHPTEPGFCPVTGLPLGDGYKSIDDTVTGFTGTYTLQAVSYPQSVQIIDGGRYYPADEGRRYFRTCGTYRNTLPFLSYFTSGRHILVDTDKGIGFEYPNNADGDRNDIFVSAGRSAYLCQTWQIPDTAQTIIVPVNLGDDQSDIHLYRVDRGQ